MEEQNNRTKAETLTYLRNKIQQIEEFSAISRTKKFSFGASDIDTAFSGGSFPTNAVHDFLCKGKEDAAATMGFMASLLFNIVGNDGVLIWITKSRTIFPPGLLTAGLKPDRIIFIELGRDQEALWAMEESLRTKGLSAVVAEVNDADLTATRRLQLAVEDSGVTGFLMRVDPRKTVSSSCVTSWVIKPLPSHLDGLPGVGFPRWNVALKKVRNGTPGEWQIEWRNNAFYLVEAPKPQRIQNDLVRMG